MRLPAVQFDNIREVEETNVSQHAAYTDHVPLQFHTVAATATVHGYLCKLYQVLAALLVGAQ